MKFLAPICDLNRVGRAVADIMLFFFMASVAAMWFDYFTN